MTTEAKMRTVTLTDRPPVRVSEATWPVIASARRGDGAVECQDNHRWHLTVRAHAAKPVVDGEYEPHADGRLIVYGSETGGPGGVHAKYEDARAGEIVEPGADVAAVIRRVGERARCSEAMIDECIADLPAESLDEDDAPAKTPEIRMPLDGACRLLHTIEKVAASGSTGIDPKYAEDLRAVAVELRAVIES